MDFDILARPRNRLSALVVVAGLLASVALVNDPTTSAALFTATIYAIAAVGLDYYSGLSGQLAFGNFGFVALGAYFMPVMSAHFDMPALAGAILTPVFCGVVAVIIGIPMSRLAGLGSAFITFFFGFVVQALLLGQSLKGLTGGAAGLTVPELRIGGTDFYLAEREDAYLAVGVLAVTLAITMALAVSATGRRLRLMKRNATVTAVAGFEPRRLRVQAFAVSAMCAGAAGVVYAQYLGSISPDGFSPTESIALFAIIAVGGMGTLVGAVIGAVLYEVLLFSFPSLGQSSQIVFAVVVLVVLVLMPDGIFGRGRTIVMWLWHRIGAPHAASTLKRPAGNADTARLGPSGSAPASSAALRIIDLSVEYGGVRAVDEVSFDVAPGSVCALVGPNGAGKTSLLNTVNRIQPACHGAVLVDDLDLLSVRATRLARLGITRTYQHPTLAPDLSAEENVAVVCARGFGSSRPAMAQARGALAIIGLDEARWELPAATLTLGEQKLTDIARAIVGSPRLILMDEPTAGLEESEMHAIAEAVRAVHKHSHTTFLIVAHHIGFVRQVADHVIVLNFGRLVGQGEVDEVFARADVGEVFVGGPRG